jgi:hypothetical protein
MSKLTIESTQYLRVLERILGFDPRIDHNEIEEILAGKRSCDMGELILELQSTLNAVPSQSVQ